MVAGSRYRWVKVTILVVLNQTTVSTYLDTVRSIHLATVRRGVVEVREESPETDCRQCWRLSSELAKIRLMTSSHIRKTDLEMFDWSPDNCSAMRHSLFMYQKWKGVRRAKKSLRLTRKMMFPPSRRFCGSTGRLAAFRSEKRRERKNKVGFRILSFDFIFISSQSCRVAF